VVKISERRWRGAEVFQLSVGTDQQESMRICLFNASSTFTWCVFSSKPGIETVQRT